MNDSEQEYAGQRTGFTIVLNANNLVIHFDKQFKKKVLLVKKSVVFFSKLRHSWDQTITLVQFRI